MSDFRRRLMRKKIESELPSGYTKLKCLINDADNYMSLGESFADNFGYEFDAECFENNLYVSPCGCNFNSIALFNGQIVYQNNKYGTKGKHSYYHRRKGTTREIGNEEWSVSFTNPVPSSFKFLIFGLGYSNNDVPHQDTGLTASQACQMKGKIYSLKIYNNYDMTNIIHDLVPCLDNNNEPCMYDKITKNTYYNLRSGGQFLYEI